MNRKHFIAGVLGLTLLAAGIGGISWKTPPMTASDDAVLVARRLAPAGEASETVTGKRSQRIEFEYELTNTSQEMLHGLQLKLPCACQIVRQPPEAFPPGESARIGFRLTAPAAGTNEFTVSITQAGRDEPVLTLPCRIRTEVTVPGWHREPRNLYFTIVAGHDEPGVVQLQTIEKRNSTPWIHSISMDGASGLSIAFSHSDGLSLQDPTLCIRNYDLHFSGTALAAGSYSGMLHVQTGSPDETIPLVWRAEVLPRISVYPDQVTLTGTHSEDPVSLTVVDRAGTGHNIEVDYDISRLEVRQIGDAEQAVRFVVRAAGLNTGFDPTIVSFRNTEGALGTVTIRFDPAEP